MKFKAGDADDGIIFRKTSSITLIDKMFLKEESETIILNQWSKHGQLPETTPASSTSAYTEITLKETLSRLIPMIAVPIFALAFIIGIIFCVCRKKKNDKNETLIPLQTLNSPNDATSKLTTNQERAALKNTNKDPRTAPASTFKD